MQAAKTAVKKTGILLLNLRRIVHTPKAPGMSMQTNAGNNRGSRGEERPAFPPNDVTVFSVAIAVTVPLPVMVRDAG